MQSVIERRSFDFNGIEVSFQNIDGEWWIDSAELAKALGYKDKRAVMWLHSRKSDYFLPEDSTLLKLSNERGKLRQTRLFTPLASQQLALLGSTPLCKKYLRFAARVMLQLHSGQAALVSRADVQRMIEADRKTTESRVRAEVTAELLTRFEVFMRDVIAKKDAQIDAMAGFQNVLLSHAGKCLSYASHSPEFRQALQEQRERKAGQRWLPGMDTNLPELGGGNLPASLN